MSGTTSRTKTATVELKARMKEGLRVQIEMAARERGVSLNAEMIARLEQSFREDRVLAALERIEAKLNGGFVQDGRPRQSYARDFVKMLDVIEGMPPPPQ